jgi:hypothetical protein
MWKPWNSVPGFSALGLTFAGVSYLYAAFSDSSQPMSLVNLLATSLSVILCPTQLFFLMCIDCEVSGWDGFTTYSIIGLLNTLLYAAVGYMVLAARKKADSPTDGEKPPSIIRGN